jgi:hypothetical protein
MPTITVEPIVMRDSLITIGANDHQSACSGCTFTPTTSSISWYGLTPDSTHTFPGVTSWVCQLDYAQDWTTADSLSRYLHEHEGESVSVVFEPKNGDPSVTATLVITPGAIGGTVNTVAVGSVQLGVSGKPVVAPVV